MFVRCTCLLAGEGYEFVLLLLSVHVRIAIDDQAFEGWTFIVWVSLWRRSARYPVVSVSYVTTVLTKYVRRSVQPPPGSQRWHAHLEQFCSWRLVYGT